MNYLDVFFQFFFKDEHFPTLPLKFTINMGDQTTINQIKHIKETMKLK